MPQIEYTVHAVLTTTMPAKVEYNGQTITAAVNCLEVEMLPPEGSRHSCPTQRFVGEDYEWAKGYFVTGKKVVWSFI